MTKSDLHNCSNRASGGSVMANRKVYVDVMTRLIICVGEGVEVSEVLENIDCHFAVSHAPHPNYATIEDTEIIDWKIKCDIIRSTLKE
jgi:hypothetical protein